MRVKCNLNDFIIAILLFAIHFNNSNAYTNKHHILNFPPNKKGPLFSIGTFRYSNNGETNQTVVSNTAITGVTQITSTTSSIINRSVPIETTITSTNTVTNNTTEYETSISTWIEVSTLSSNSSWNDAATFLSVLIVIVVVVMILMTIIIIRLERSASSQKGKALRRRPLTASSESSQSSPSPLLFAREKAPESKQSDRKPFLPPTLGLARNSDSERVDFVIHKSIKSMKSRRKSMKTAIGPLTNGRGNKSIRYADALRDQKSKKSKTEKSKSPFKPGVIAKPISKMGSENLSEATIKSAKTF